MTVLSRRAFLGAVVSGIALPGLGQDSLPTQAPAGKLWDPGRAGPPLQPVTAEDNDAAIQAIEKQLKCTCGCGLDVYTCRTTDFSCQYSPQMHRRVIQLAKAGMSGQAIVAQFVSEHGLEILMAPPKRGFNLTGYYVPAAAMLTAAGLLFLAMRRWVRRAAQATATPGAVAAPEGVAASEAELQRLRDALQHTDA